MNPPAAPEVPLVSVVVAARNEAANLPLLADEVAAALDPTGLAWELIVVDDASDDVTPLVLAGLLCHHRALRALRHPRRCGQSAALASGWRAARGELVVTMDGDLQHDPADIPDLLAALTDDAAAVTGFRPHRQDSRLRRLSSRVANAYRRAITGDGVRDAGCTLRVIRRAALAEIPVFNGTHRFLPTLLRAQGYTVLERPIHHRPRRFGTSHYGIHNRLWRGIADCLAVRWYARRAVPALRAEAISPAAPDRPAGAHAPTPVCAPARHEPAPGAAAPVGVPADPNPPAAAADVRAPVA